MGLGDTCYPSFMSLTMEEFDSHLYLYYFNGLNPSPMIKMKSKYNNSDTVQGNDFLKNVWSQFCKVTQVVKLMLCMPVSTEVNTNTKVVSRLDISPLLESHLIYVPFFIVAWLFPLC